ncbi:MAG TPA: hypothetical protein VNT60_04370 [Deinococcales bacterium]|nr:hypothetical protein [Deinococcales bacterium]
MALETLRHEAPGMVVVGYGGPLRWLKTCVLTAYATEAALAFHLVATARPSLLTLSGAGLLFVAMGLLLAAFMRLVERTHPAETRL